MNCARMAFLLAFISFTAGASAEEIERLQVKGWNIGAYVDDNTKEFTHCAMNSTYKSGISLVFSLDKSISWSMGLYKSEWKLTPGKEYHFDMALDNARGAGWSGKAVNENLIKIPLQRTYFQDFRFGRLLTISAPNGTFSFYLTDTNEALPFLSSCVQKHLSGSSSNPFEAGSAIKADATSAALYAEAAVTSTNILAGAGVSNYRLLPIDKIQKEFAGEHAVWLSSGAAGTLRIYPQAHNTDDLAAHLIANASTECKGKFATGKSATQDKTSKTEIVCENEGKITHFFFVLFPRPSGGTYVFTIFTGDDQVSSQQTADKVSDLIMAAKKY